MSNQLSAAVIGTGFIGPHMVREALRRGHSVTLFNRGRTIPYIGTFVTGFGMLWHFIGQLATFSRRQLAAKGAAA